MMVRALSVSKSRTYENSYISPDIRSDISLAQNGSPDPRFPTAVSRVAKLLTENNVSSGACKKRADPSGSGELLQVLQKWDWKVGDLTLLATSVTARHPRVSLASSCDFILHDDDDAKNRADFLLNKLEHLVEGIPKKSQRPKGNPLLENATATLTPPERHIFNDWQLSEHSAKLEELADLYEVSPWEFREIEICTLKKI